MGITLIVLFYNQELVKKIFGEEYSVFPKQKKYSMIILKTRVSKSSVSDQLFLSTSTVPRLRCMASVSESRGNTASCENLIKLLNNEPDYIFSSNHADNLIIANMKIIHEWKNVNHIHTPKGKVGINIEPAPKELLNYYGFLSDSVATGFTDTLIYNYYLPLKIGKYSILLPYIKYNVNYWITEPLVINPTLNDYIKKYINMVKKNDFTGSLLDFDTISHYSFINSESSVKKINGSWYYSKFQVYREPKSEELRIIKFDFRPGHQIMKNRKTGEVMSILSINFPNNKWVSFISVINLETEEYNIYKTNGLPYSDEVITNLYKWNSQSLMKTLYNYITIIVKNGAMSIAEHLKD